MLKVFFAYVETEGLRAHVYTVYNTKADVINPLMPKGSPFDESNRLALDSKIYTEVGLGQERGGRNRRFTSISINSWYG